MQDKLKEIPQKPGVYIMKDAGGNILYVGKAARLKSRLSSYFQHTKTLTLRIKSLVDSIADFEYIITDSELEALMLESVLIKKRRPKYNIILKDDKHYPYLKLTTAEKYPRLTIIRRIADNDGNAYFGPYVPTKALHQTLRLIYDIFPLRQCRRINYSSQRPCVNFQLKRCLAPCGGQVDDAEYQRLVQEVKLFLQGKNKELIGLLTRQMQDASGELRFEQAAKLRDQIAAIEKITEKQKIISSVSKIDQDIIALAKTDDTACFQIFFIRHGILTGHKNLMLKQTAQIALDELLYTFLIQFYNEKERLPANILIPEKPANHILIGQWLNKKRGGKVNLHIPQLGEKYQLLKMAEENARLRLDNYQLKQEKSNQALIRLKNDLGLEKAPNRIEAFDISNIQGAIPVGSMVVWQEGNLCKKDYKRFKIKTVKQINDCAMLAEVIRRRYTRVLKDKLLLPDLILVDGGKGQLNIAYEALKDLGLLHIPILGLAKREEEIFMPDKKEALRLDLHSPSLQLLQKIRDEAHRFAITYHRKSRRKMTLASRLSQISGIGAAKQKRLLLHFGSLKNIQTAGLDELESLSFLDKKTAKNVFEFLRENT